MAVSAKNLTPEHLSEEFGWYTRVEITVRPFTKTSSTELSKKAWIWRVSSVGVFVLDRVVKRVCGADS